MATCLLQVLKLTLRLLFIQARKKNYAFPRYVWIHYDWYPKNWWRSDRSVPGDCSDDELMEFLDKALTIQLPEFGNETTEIGTVSEQLSSTSKLAKLNVYSTYSAKACT